MLKRKIDAKSVEFDNFEVESGDEDFSADEEDYEPTAEEIAAADADDYDSESGESVDHLELNVREAAAVRPDILYTSKDGKVIYSSQPNGSVRKYNMNTIPGNKTAYY